MSFTDEPEFTQAFQSEFNHIWANAKEIGESRFENADDHVESGADVVFTSANLEPSMYRGSPTFRTNGDLPGVCGERLIKAIRSAKSEIPIATAHFRRFDIHNELLLAMKRGIKVQLLLDRQEYHSEKTDTPNALYDEALAHAGAQVRYKVYSHHWDYRTALQMHCKYMVIDDREVLTGSLNWSENAELNTFENLVSLTDSSVVSKYRDRFSMKWRYGDGDLAELEAKLEKSKGRYPCSFKPIAMTGELLLKLRARYAKNACQ